MNCRCLWAVFGAALITSCSSPPKPATARPIPAPAYWIGHRTAGSPRMVIHLSQQRLLYFKGGRLVGVSPISSGRESHATATGHYKIIEKDIGHRSSLYGNYVASNGAVVRRDADVRKDPAPPGSRFVGADMRYFMRITGAIGMHEGYLPGYPASHGCIRLPGDMAAVFFRETPLGTPVQIVGRAPPPQWTVAVPPAPPARAESRGWFGRRSAPAATGALAQGAKPSSAKPPHPRQQKPKKSFGVFSRKPQVPRGTTLYLDP